jgi:protein-S-isoprenylcysteine O-methyltransferase Ste14
MKDNVFMKTSALATNGILLIFALIISGAMFYFAGWENPTALCVGAFVAALVIGWLVQLWRWSKMDAASRPEMKFPKKAAHIVFWTVFFGGLLIVWLVREIDKGFSNWH